MRFVFLPGPPLFRSKTAGRGPVGLAFWHFIACLLAVTLGFAAPHAHAGRGVDLVTTAPVYLPAVGDMGGTAQGPFFCPVGQVITGFNFTRFSSTPFGPHGAAIQGRCSLLGADGLTATLATTPAMGGVGNYPTVRSWFRCAPGTVVSGWRPYISQSTYIDGLEPYCSRLTVTDAAVSVGEPVATGLLMGGNNRDGGVAVCPAGTVASGFQGRTGHALDRIQLICFPIRSQYMSLTIVTAPPLADYAGFGVDITDASGVLRLRTEGASNQAYDVLTAGPYTASPVIPPSHFLSSSYCPASFNLAPGGAQECVLAALPRTPPPEAGLAFDPPAVSPHQASTLTITLTNRQIQPAYGMSLIDTLPQGLVFTGLPPSTTCPDATLAPSTSTQLSLAGGNLAAGGSCTVTAQVVAAAVGRYTNRIPPGQLHGWNLLANAGAAEATLEVRLPARLRLQVVADGAPGSRFAFQQTNLAGIPPDIVTVAVGVAAPAAPTAIDVLSAGTPATVTLVAPAGFRTTGATCRDAQSAVTGNAGNLGALAGNVLSLPASALVSGADIGCVFTLALRPEISGRLFTDDGSGGGIANDGRINGAEAGRSGEAVVLGDCAGTRHAETLTDGSGSFHLPVPATHVAGSPLCVDAALPASRHSTGASAGGVVLPPGILQNLGTAGYTYSRGGSFDRIALRGPVPDFAGLDFASVPRSGFVLGDLRTGRPGVAVVHPHIFTAGTVGSVSFSVPRSVATLAADGWSQQVFADPDCSRELRANATLLYPPALPVPVTGGQIVCILLHEFVPPNARTGTRNDTTLEARLAFRNASPALEARYQLTDSTTVGSDVVTLVKEVRNVSETAEAFGSANRARPRDVLEYRITYRNTGPAPVRDLAIHDATPAYSTFESASAGPLPASVTACTKTTPAAPLVPLDCALGQATGGQGSLAWSLDGPLAPGASGWVAFRVRVD